MMNIDATECWLIILVIFRCYCAKLSLVYIKKKRKKLERTSLFYQNSEEILHHYDNLVRINFPVLQPTCTTLLYFPLHASQSDLHMHLIDSFCNRCCSLFLMLLMFWPPSVFICSHQSDFPPCCFPVVCFLLYPFL